MGAWGQKPFPVLTSVMRLVLCFASIVWSVCSVMWWFEAYFVCSGFCLVVGYLYLVWLLLVGLG
ncbi:hypothetical protein BDV25DRAFT_154297 [Aspergillus avenaceus]|uniref:Uncharacterized protein n=1 Tax=Aspergillus avenaceus TaxID=36643 RepID=A0A5N6TW02_ASPAV|nr:hypothetical protein BDV25DRAFT_154297 [Aspergillus avenaceus]